MKRGSPSSTFKEETERSGWLSNMFGDQGDDGMDIFTDLMSTHSLNENDKPTTSPLTDAISSTNASRPVQRHLKRHAAKGQWLTPPHQFFPTNAANDTSKKPESGTLLSASKVNSQSLQFVSAAPIAVPVAKEVRENTKQASGVHRSSSLPVLSNFPNLDLQKELCHRTFQRKRTTTKHMSTPIDIKKSDESSRKRSRSHNQFDERLAALDKGSSSAGPSPTSGDKDMPKSKMRMVMSCPNLMAMMCARMERENERREQRLSRNRASARLRRMRKKSVVDQLKVEVDEVSRQLSILKRLDSDADVVKNDISDQKSEAFVKSVHPLLNTFTKLQRDYIVSPSRRLDNMKFAIDECACEVDMLKSDLLWSLHLIDSLQCASSSDDVATRASELVARAKRQQCRAEKMKKLGMSAATAAKIDKIASAIELEYLRLLSIQKCFAASRERKWHVLDTVDTWNSMFTSALSQEQVQRLLSWIKKNGPVISRINIKTDMASYTGKGLG